MFDRLPMSVFHRIVTQSSVLDRNDALQLLLCNKYYARYIHENHGLWEDLYVLYGSLRTACYYGRYEIVDRKNLGLAKLTREIAYDIISASCEGKQFGLVRAMIVGTDSGLVFDMAVRSLFKCKQMEKACELIVEFAHLLSSSLVEDIILHHVGGAHPTKTKIATTLRAVKDQAERVVIPNSFFSVVLERILRGEDTDVTVLAPE